MGIAHRIKCSCNCPTAESPQNRMRQFLFSPVRNGELKNSRFSQTIFRRLDLRVP
jgi:hypothetical protein